MPFIRSILLLSVLLTAMQAVAAKNVIRAGAFVADVTPTQLPVIVNGGFREKTSNTVYDRLHARCLVLDDGAERIALVVVDSCMTPRDLCDQAKHLAAKTTGIRVDRMLISSTHTHSAPSAMGALGSNADPNYVKELPGMIAEGIRQANERLQPARVGWAVVEAPEHTNCRRWILRADKMRNDPFGEKTVRAMMHPGHQNPSFIGPSGPVDTGLSLLAVQSLDGQPLAMFANFSMHYYGSGALSADFCGAFSDEFAKQIKAGDHFVAAMSQGTSGDLQWMDYGQPRSKRDIRAYSAGLAAIAKSAWEKIEYRDWVPLAMAEAKVKLKRRVADEKRLAWARKLTEGLKGRKPVTQQQIYAREQVFIANDPVRELILQAARIGDLGITAIPNEVYSITGLKLKALSPLQPTMNIELANGGEGYIPPPEQHDLGGYTTWEARSAALATNAEPQIVETLLTLLEQVAGKPRRSFAESHGSYPKAILAEKPLAYWRLGELAGRTVADSSGHGHTAKLDRGFALHLEGPPGSGFCEHGTINRSIQFAGGRLVTALDELPANHRIEFWFWHGVSAGALFSRGSDSISLTREGALSFNGAKGKTKLKPKTWHHVAMERSGNRVSVALDGKNELSTEQTPTKGSLVFGEGFEGRLDEIAVFGRRHSPASVARRLHLSGVAEWREDQRIRQRKAFAAQTHQKAKPRFKNDYRNRINELKPVMHWPGDKLKGRVKADVKGLPVDYSVSVWFRNDQPNRSRAVTGYFFSRGPDGDRMCPGDHLGIGGSYRDSRPGHLFVYNGNKLSQVALGKTVIDERTWNHAVMVRRGNRVLAYLNGKLEIDAELPRSIEASETRIYFGGRNDNFSNLNGHLDEAAIFGRALTAKEALALYEAAGVKAPTKSVAARIAPLDSEALSPSDGLRSIKVRDGYMVELVAAEPMVRDPVAIDWGADGRMWVVEMADYPNGMDDQGKPGGRIRVLTDEDRDGRYEKSELFLDGLNFPTGVLAWKQGVLITAAPEIIYAEDSDGDGKADSKKVMYAGFHEGNQQLRVNGLRWGLDGWIYCASGSHHAGYGSKTIIKSHTGKTFDLGSRDFKIKPETGDLIPLSGPSQFGRARDDWGNWFGVQNSYPIWHYVIEDEHLQRNPYVNYPSPKKLLTERNPKVYPAKQPQKRFHNFTQSGRFTSACSVAIYRDELLFGRTNTHAFTCEPFHNLVQHHLLTPEGVSFKRTRDPAETKLDFFTSTDRWCRPVQVRTGPDGALWVVDMYRYMIEHPQWLPPAGREELRPHYRAGEERGRIYRVVRSGVKLRPIKNLLKLSREELAHRTQAPNGIERDLANSLRLESPRQQIDTLSEIEDPRARRLAIRRLAGSRMNEKERKALARQLRDESAAQVKLEIALVAGNLPGRNFGEILAAYANADLGDPHMRSAVLSSLPRHFEMVAGSALDHAGVRHPLFADLLRMEHKLGSGKTIVLNQLLETGDRGYSREQFEIMAAFLQDLVRERADLSSTLKRATGMLNSARKAVTDEKAASIRRVAAIQLLGRQPDLRDSDLALLKNLLRPDNPVAIQNGVVAALIRGWRSLAVKALAERWRRLSPAVRQSALDSLLSQAASSKALLREIRSGQIAASDLSAAQRQRLTKHRDKSLRQLAIATLKTSRNPDRQAVVKKFQPALNLKGDSAKGREVFEKVCHVCHRTDQKQPVGPDLRSITDKSAAGLLTAILDPNQSVDPRYTTYTIDLKDDTSLTGRIVSESGNSITLLTAEAKRHDILRPQIGDVQASRLSLMPEGLEAGLTPQQLADVIALIRAMK